MSQEVLRVSDNHQIELKQIHGGFNVIFNGVVIHWFGPKKPADEMVANLRKALHTGASAKETHDPDNCSLCNTGEKR